MTERRDVMTEKRSDAADDVLAADLQVLRRETDRDLPTLQDTARRLAAQATAPRPSRKGWIMKSVLFLRLRPWLATAAATVAVLAILFVIPISYERTTGHDVILTLSGPGVGPETLAQLSHGL